MIREWVVQREPGLAMQRQPIPQTNYLEPDNVGGNDISELVASLRKLDLSDDHMSRVTSLLRSARSIEAIDQQHEPADPVPVTTLNTVTIFLAEEQEIFKTALLSCLADRPGLTIVGSSDDVSSESLVSAGLTLRPQVMFLGVKVLNPAIVETLELIREACPQMALVVLFSFSTDHAIKSLREFSMDTSVGRAYLPKHTIDSREQLAQIVHSVAQGRMIIDPSIMGRLFKSEQPLGQQLKDLSPKAMEVLHWLAKGYRNDIIAQRLSRDTKTIERHINNIYSTFEDDNQNDMHPRVRAALIYLKAAGRIVPD